MGREIWVEYLKENILFFSFFYFFVWESLLETWINYKKKMFGRGNFNETVYFPAVNDVLGTSPQFKSSIINTRPGCFSPQALVERQARSGGKMFVGEQCFLEGLMSIGTFSLPFINNLPNFFMIRAWQSIYMCPILAQYLIGNLLNYKNDVLNY